MEIGDPQRIYTIEPIEDPIPRPAPAEPDEVPWETSPDPSEPLVAP